MPGGFRRDVFSHSPQVLEQLGIQPYRRDKLSLANGEFIERERGIAVFNFHEHEGTSDLLFGEEGDTTLLGIVSLEQIGLIIDPIRHELHARPLLLVGMRDAKPPDAPSE
jgi:hypothetical protein